MIGIDDFMAEVSERIKRLRDELRQGATIRSTLPEAMKLSGDVFIESVGTIANIANGTGEFFYTPDAALLRGPVLQQLADPRRELYRKIAAQLKPKSRVLVIGAGSDVDVIQCLLDHGHEVIATDFAEDVVSALQRRISVPAFACDLIHLDRVLPEPVDYVVGNSVLGYLDPRKTKKVIANLWDALIEGGVFTFDQTPHPSYFDIAENRTQQHLVNPSAADPRKLTEYVERLGPSAGIAAMAIYSYNRGRSINFATISVLSQLFGSHGGVSTIGEYDLVVAGRGTHPDPTLRIAKADTNVLESVDGESRFDDVQQALEAARGGRPGLRLQYVDRGAGESLARVLGIHTNAREDAWEVIRYVSANQPSDADLEAQEGAVLAELDVTVAASRIVAAINAGAYTPTKRMRKAVAVDQTIHSGIVTGSMPATPDRADVEIDRVYAEEQQLALQRMQRPSATPAARSRKDERKKQKEARKRQRRR